MNGLKDANPEILAGLQKMIEFWGPMANSADRPADDQYPDGVLHGIAQAIEIIDVCSQCSAQIERINRTVIYWMRVGRQGHGHSAYRFAQGAHHGLKEVVRLLAFSGGA